MMVKSKHGRRKRLFVTAFVGVGVAITLALVLLLFGSVTGTEFSPTHFETRHFMVSEIPWLQIQISPIRRVSLQSSTARYLVAKSLIKPPPNAPQTWHLVELTRGGLNQSLADAKLLTQQLELVTDDPSASGTNDEYWRTWSEREPEKAKVFWPVIQTLAIRELYILMPSLFEMAIHAKDSKSLRQSIDDYLRSTYHELVLEMRDANRTELANALLLEALADYPDDSSLRALQ
jgi:hypothetical protein